MAGEGERKLAAALEDTIGGLERATEHVPALLGAYVDGQKFIVVTDQPDYVWCRIGGNESRRVKAFNQHAGGVAQHWDLPIIIVKDKLNANVWKVVGRDITRYPDWGKTANYPYSSPYIAHHGGDHSFSGQAGMGADPVWVFKRQMMPLLPHPAVSGSMGIEIGSDFYYFDGQYNWFASTGTAAFTSFLPTGAMNGRFVTVYIEGDTGNPAYLAGPEINAVIPPIDAGDYISVPTASQGVPVAAVFLLTGTTRIGWGEIFDLRWPHTPIPFTDHGVLGGLGDDDHSQYLHLPGRVGAQTISGSVIVLDDLIVGPDLATPDGTLHVHTASAGQVTASTVADQLILENSSPGGLSILTPGNAAGHIAFGSPSGSLRGRITYDHFFDELAFYTEAVQRVSISSSVILFNASSTDTDLRVPGNNDPQLIRTDAGNNRVGIGTQFPAFKFHVSGSFGVSGPIAGFAGDVHVTGTVYAGAGSFVTEQGYFRGQYLDTIDQGSPPAAPAAGRGRWYSQSGLPRFEAPGGTIYDLTAPGATRFAVGQPTSLGDGATGIYWRVPDSEYYTGSLAVALGGVVQSPTIDYQEQHPGSGTYEFLTERPPTGSVQTVWYGVEA